MTLVGRVSLATSLSLLTACSHPPVETARAPKPQVAREAAPLYLDATRPVDERVGDLLGRLTLAEKASLLGDKAAGIERLGIPKYDAWNEALHGVSWRDGVTVFPQAIGLASTWDPALLHRVATAISTEARALFNTGSFGLTLWSPVINLGRDPRWGRTQEGYGEDPFLASRLAVAYVTGIQGPDPFYFRAVATPKHFGLNNVEATRFTGSSNVPEEVIRDYYFPQFRAAVVEGHAQSIMCAYNRINGVPACGDPWLLDTVLRKEWGFDGFVVSDCGAIGAMLWGHHVKSTPSEAVTTAIRAGCDLECGGDYQKLIGQLVERGELAEAEIDRALGRVLTARFRLGMFDPPDRNPYASIPMSVVDSPEHRALAREAARQSLVLLKNDQVLPLDGARVKKLAVIGPAASLFMHGSQGYHGTNDHLIAPLEGIKARAGKDVSVAFVAGTVLPSGAGLPTSPLPEALLSTPDGKPGLAGEYFPNTDLSGAPALERREAQVDLDWGGNSPGEGVPPDGFSARFRGKLTPKETGQYLLSVTGDDGYRLLLDGKALIVDWTDHAPRTRGAVVTLTAGAAHELVLEYYERGGGASLRLAYAFVGDQRQEALRAAREADAVVFVAGVDELAADEEKDFPSLALPENQTDLLAAVMKANRRVTLVILSGNPLVLSQTELEAPAIVQAWYPGQDTGAVLAELLFGDLNPSGKLPITFYASLADLPPMDDYDVRKGRTYMYLEKKANFAFGFGLSYTTFVIDQLSVTPSKVTSKDSLEITVDVTNTGERAGAEVVQLYVKPPRGPKQVLRAFRRVSLAAARSEHVTFTLPVAELAHYDAEAKKDVVDPGQYEILVGASSADIRQRAGFTVSPRP